MRLESIGPEEEEKVAYPAVIIDKNGTVWDAPPDPDAYISAPQKPRVTVRNVIEFEPPPPVPHDQDERDKATKKRLKREKK